MQKISLGILRETKTPPDRRVPFTPSQCRSLLDRYEHLELVVQPSDYRCYSDDEYAAQRITLSEDVSSCDILMGVKEVKLNALIDQKTYLFFSHTAKKQPYNRELLQEVVHKGIRLVDYEYLTDEKGIRVVAFGRWAGTAYLAGLLPTLASSSSSCITTPSPNTSHPRANHATMLPIHQGHMTSSCPC